MKKNVMELISEEKIYPIVRNKDAQKAIDIAHALIEGGIKVMEITVENPSLYSAITEISKDAVVCAGGIITQQQAEQALTSGAKLFSSPIYQMNMVKISKNRQMPFIAGASTPNEAYDAWKSRIPLIKIFPVTALGGVQYIEDVLRPMPFLNLMPMDTFSCQKLWITSKLAQKQLVLVEISMKVCQTQKLQNKHKKF